MLLWPVVNEVFYLENWFLLAFVYGQLRLSWGLAIFHLLRQLLHHQLFRRLL